MPKSHAPMEEELLPGGWSRPEFTYTPPEGSPFQRWDEVRFGPLTGLVTSFVATPQPGTRVYPESCVEVLFRAFAVSSCTGGSIVLTRETAEADTRAMVAEARARGEEGPWAGGSQPGLILLCDPRSLVKTGRVVEPGSAAWVLRL